MMPAGTITQLVATPLCTVVLQQLSRKLVRRAAYNTRVHMPL